MRWIDEFLWLDGMNAGLTQQWLLTADCSTTWRQRQETLGHPVTTFYSSWYDKRWRTRWSQTLSDDDTDDNIVHVYDTAGASDAWSSTGQGDNCWPSATTGRRTTETAGDGEQTECTALSTDRRRHATADRQGNLVHYYTSVSLVVLEKNYVINYVYDRSTITYRNTLCSEQNIHFCFVFCITLRKINQFEWKFQTK